MHTRYTYTGIWFRLRVALVAFTRYIGYVDTLYLLRLRVMFVAFTHYACCVYALLRLHGTNAESKRTTFTFPLTCTVRSTEGSKLNYSILRMRRIGTAIG